MRRNLLATVAVAFLLAAQSANAQGLPGTSKASDRAAWNALLRIPASCQHDWNATAGAGGSSGIVSEPTATVGLRLVSVTCFYGAYQGVTVFYLVDASRKVTGPIRLSIHVDPGSGKPTLGHSTPRMAVESFVPKTGVLTIFDKARGPGDCGIFSTFKLTGTHFVPVSARAKRACDGKPPFDPGKWPKLPTPAA